MVKKNEPISLRIVCTMSSWGREEVSTKSKRWKKRNKANRYLVSWLNNHEKYNLKIYKRRHFEEEKIHSLKYLSGEYGYSFSFVDNVVSTIDLQTMKKVDECKLLISEDDFRLMGVTESYFYGKYHKRAGVDEGFVYDRHLGRIVFQYEADASYLIQMLIVNHTLYYTKGMDEQTLLTQYDLQNKQQKNTTFYDNMYHGIRLYKDMIMFYSLFGEIMVYTQDLQCLDVIHLNIYGRLYCSEENIYIYDWNTIRVFENLQKLRNETYKLIRLGTTIHHITAKYNRLYVGSELGGMEIYDEKDCTCLDLFFFDAQKITNSEEKIKEIHVINRHEILVKYTSCVIKYKRENKERYEQIQPVLDLHLPKDISNIIIEEVKHAELVW